MTDQLYLGSPQNYIDAAKYFSDWATIKVLHFTQLDTKKNDMILTFKRFDGYSYTIIIENCEKNNNVKHLFLELNKHGITLSPQIAKSNISKMKSELFNEINKLASYNTFSLPSKPGFSYMHTPNSLSNINMFSDYTHPGYYPNAFLDMSVVSVITPPPIDFIRQDPIAELKVRNIQSIFLLVLRYLASLLPLRTSICNFTFPFIVVISSNTFHSNILPIIKRYLLMFRPTNQSNSTIYSINESFLNLNGTISARNNNILLLEALMDPDNIRNENINLIRDNFNIDESKMICCILSNSVDTKLNSNEFINVQLDDIVSNLNDQAIRIADWYFVNSVTAYSRVTEKYIRMFGLFEESNKAYSIHFNNHRIQKAVVSFMAVFKIMATCIFKFRLDDMRDSEIETKLFEYISGLFDTVNTSDDDSSILVSKFASLLEEMIINEQINLLMNDKSNKALYVDNTGFTIYKEPGLLVIQTDVFDKLCTIANIKPYALKKALNKDGYLEQNGSIYIKKTTIYPAGQSPNRCNVYMIRDSILDRDIIDKIEHDILLRPFYTDHTINFEKGIGIGYDYKGDNVVWSYKALLTSHMMVTGKSGSGKTTFITNIVKKLDIQNEYVIIFDYSNSYINNSHITERSTIYSEKMPVNPFVLRTNEKRNAYINRIERLLSQVFKLSDSASNKLKTLLSSVYDENNGLNLEKLKDARSDGTIAQSLIKTVDFIIDYYENSNYKTWADLEFNRNIIILKIDDSLANYEITTEFLLQDLYGFKEKTNLKRLFIVVDEIQNMIRNNSSSIISILSQGRDKELGLIMSTQSFKTIPGKYQSMFLQSGLNVFFQPEITAIEMISKLIKADLTADRVSITLKKLGVGESLAYGSFEDQQGRIVSDSLMYISSKRIELKSIKRELNESAIKDQKTESIDLTIEYVGNYSDSSNIRKPSIDIRPLGADRHSTKPDSTSNVEEPTKTSSPSNYIAPNATDSPTTSTAPCVPIPGVESIKL